MVDYNAPKNAKFNFKRVSQLTIPSLRTKGGTTVFVYMLQPFHAKPDIDRYGNPKHRDDGTPATITLADVVDLQDRNHCHMVVGTVLDSELNRGYPNASYVGKAFEIYIPKDVEAGKKYKMPRVIEIEVPDFIDEVLGSLLPPRKHAEIIAGAKKDTKK